MIYETDTDRIMFYNGTGWVISYEPWQTYTSTLTASTPPNIGTTGTALGSYQRSNGDCFVRVAITFGGTGITSGSGNFSVTLPFNRDISGAFAASALEGTGMVYTASGTKSIVGFGAGGTTSAVTIFGSAATFIGSSSATWGAGDQVVGGFHYKMAQTHSF